MKYIHISFSDCYKHLCFFVCLNPNQQTSKLQIGTGTIKITTGSVAALTSGVALISKRPQQSDIVVKSPDSSMRSRMMDGHRLLDTVKDDSIKSDDHEINNTNMESTMTPTSMNSSDALKASLPGQETIYSEKRNLLPLTNAELATSDVVHSPANNNQYSKADGDFNVVGTGQHNTDDDDKLKKRNEDLDDGEQQQQTIMREKTEHISKPNHIPDAIKNSISPRINERIRSKFFTSLQTTQTTQPGGGSIATITPTTTTTTTTANDSSTNNVRLREKRAIFCDDLNKNSNSYENTLLQRYNETKPNSLGSSINLMSGLGYNYTSRHSLDSSSSPMSLTNSTVQLRDKETSARIMETVGSNNTSCNSIPTASKISTERRPSWRLKFDSVSKV